MKRSLACLLAVWTIVAVLALSGVPAMANGVDAMKICKEVAGSDKLISYPFCVSELTKRNGDSAPDGPVLGLAKVAADAGAKNGDNTVADIKALLEKPGTDAKTRTALEKCQEFYFYVNIEFMLALESISLDRYAMAKQQVGVAVSEARKCDDALAKAAVKPSLLFKQRSWYTVQIGIICTAIINLK